MKVLTTTTCAETTVDVKPLNRMTASNGICLHGKENIQDFCSDVYDLLRKRFGFDASRHSKHSLVRALQSRMRALGLIDLSAYMALLDSSACGYELANLVDIYTVGETSFFRYQSHDDALVNRILPELIRGRASERKLRIWSAGCATGEEPYTIAMLIREYFPELADWDVKILATDVNNISLFQADQNSYSYRSLRTVAKEFIEKYFCLGDSSFHLNDACKSMIEFKHQNLMEMGSMHDAQCDQFDIIMCRNVLIYFDDASTAYVVNQLLEKLAPDGCLFFGHTEMMQNLSSDLQSTRYHDAFYYTRRHPDQDER